MTPVGKPAGVFHSRRPPCRCVCLAQMSDHRYTLAVPAPRQEELDELHQRILDWLVAEGIVERELTDCILSMRSHGHRPAPRFMTASSAPEDPECNNCCYAKFIQMKVNGLQIIKGRHVSVAGGSYDCAICPGCGTERPVFDERWNAACTVWIEWQGAGDLECERCRVSHGLAEWRHRDTIGFGALTFNFWNWPPLSDEFRDEMARRLGHEVHLVHGRY
jgi:hypothetical protein